MSYFAPYVDETGYHYPTYNEILEALVEQMQMIYGSGIYLGNDSKDYQLLATFAEKIYDCFQCGEIAYNAHSPITSIGTGLDYIVALNGIRRKVATRSTATLNLTGTAGTTINAGKAMDDNGFLWDLPDSVTLNSSGEAMVEAVCEQPGIVQAGANTITSIATPMPGWESVTNPMAAVSGTAVETDSELRGRQAQSVATPSQSILAGLKGALQGLDDVGRVAVYENDTGETDANGLPAHSICCVVEGGDGDDIADTIRLRKGLGCGTWGGESVDVTDEDGNTTTIRYSQVEYVDVDIVINLSRRPGYAASTTTEIQAAIVNYLSEFSIGTDLTTSIIWMVAQQVNVDYRSPTFSISSVLTARHGSTPSLADVVIGFDEVARGSAANITINVT